DRDRRRGRSRGRLRELQPRHRRRAPARLCRHRGRRVPAAMTGHGRRTEGARRLAVALAIAIAVASLAAIALRRLWRGRPGELRSTTTLALRVTDRGAPVAARVLLVDARGAPLHMGNLDLYGRRQGAAACVIAPGVVGSWDGLILGRGVAD